MEETTAKSVFKKIMDGIRPENNEIGVLENWLINYVPPADCVYDPNLDDLPVFTSKNLISEASKRYVQLEKDGFLLSKLPDYKFNAHSYLYSLIFDGKRVNGFQWRKDDGFRHENGQKGNIARGYKNTLVGPGLILSDPKDLVSQQSFTKIAQDTEKRNDLPKYKKRQEFGKFYMDFHNAHLKKKVISNVPYLIFNLKNLVDEKKKNIGPMSSFDFLKIEGKLKTLGFDKIPGFAYPYVYYFFHCSTAGDHDEDYSSNSFNANYGEGVKIWRVVTRQHAHKLRKLSQNLRQMFDPEIPGDERFITICNLQHKGDYKKQALIHPGLLALYGIPYSIVVQRAGVAILTASAAMHAVINHGTGLSVAVNLLIPINFLMNPITDLCTHGFEKEEILSEMKKLSLREVAQKFPMKTMPNPADLSDTPTDDICGTRDYIKDLVDEFNQLAKPKHSGRAFSIEQVRYEYAYYALIRLIKLARIDVEFDSRNKYNFSVKINFSFPTSDLVESPFSKCPNDLEDYISYPVLVGEYDEFGELRYVQGTVHSVVQEGLQIRKLDNTEVIVSVRDRKQICKVIGNRIPLEHELVIGESVVYLLQNEFRVGILADIRAKSATPYRIKINGSELYTRQNLLRTIKPDWYGSLCTANNKGYIPLCFPEKPATPAKRPAPSSTVFNNKKQKFRYEDGHIVEFEVKEVDGRWRHFCPKCESNFTKKNPLVEHFYSAHVQGFHAFDCTECNTHYGYKRTYEVHNRDVHGGSLPLHFRPPRTSGNYIEIVNH